MSCYKAGVISFIIQLILSSVFAQDGEKVKMQIISNDFFTLPQQLDLEKTGHLLFSGTVNRQGRQYIHIIDPIHLGVEKEPDKYVRGNYISKGPDTLVTFSLMHPG